MFAKETGLAEGLVASPAGIDFEWDEDDSCYTVATCPDSGCPGWPGIQRITRLPLHHIPLHPALMAVVIN